MTRLEDMPEYLAGYVRGYTAGVEYRLNPPTRVDLEAADALGEVTFTKWSEVKTKRKFTGPGGTAAESAPTPELDAEHASRAASASAAAVPPPQVRTSDAAPSATRQAAVWGEVEGAMESVLLATIQILRENHLSVAASLVQRSLHRLRGVDGA